MKNLSTCRSYFFPDFPDGKEIAQRFAHFPIVNVQKGIVKPVAAKGTPLQHSLWAISFSWCGKIRSSPPACMSISIPQIFLRHDRTFNVPAGAAVAPGRGPGRLPFFFRLPEDKIQGILLLVLAGYQQRTAAGAGDRPDFYGKVFPYSANFLVRK